MDGGKLGVRFNEFILNYVRVTVQPLAEHIWAKACVTRLSADLLFTAVLINPQYIIDTISS